MTDKPRQMRPPLTYGGTGIRKKAYAVKTEDVLRMRCPTCHAEVSDPCIDYRAGYQRPMKHPHRARREEARAAGYGSP